MPSGASADNTRERSVYVDLEPSMALTNQTLNRTAAPSTTSAPSTSPFTEATDTQQPANSSTDDVDYGFGIPQYQQQSSTPSLFRSNPMGSSTKSSSKSSSRKSSKTSKNASPGGNNRSTPSTTNTNVGEEICAEDLQDVDSNHSTTITHYIDRKLTIPSEMVKDVDMTTKTR